MSSGGTRLKKTFIDANEVVMFLYKEKWFGSNSYIILYGDQKYRKIFSWSNKKCDPERRELIAEVFEKVE